MFQLPPASFEKCTNAPSSYNFMLSRLCPIITPSFDPKLHDVMTLPLPHFDSMSPTPSNVCCHFDVTLRHGSAPSADFSQCDTFPSPFGSIPIITITPTDILRFLTHFSCALNGYINGPPWHCQCLVLWEFQHSNCYKHVISNQHSDHIVFFLFCFFIRFIFLL